MTAMDQMLDPRKDAARRALVESWSARAPTPRLSRAMDLIIAMVALLMFGPLMMMTAIAVAAERRGPILFMHTRIGRYGQRFKVYKFRSMHVDSDHILAAHLADDPVAAAEWKRDHKLRRDPRITGLGRFLRKSSLDELPQLFNVLRGEMSIVGPRPIVEAEVTRYGRFFNAYCAVTPGITGVWQVSGRNDVTYRRRVAMDALYARRKCLSLDIRLILATIPAVINRTGSY